VKTTLDIQRLVGGKELPALLDQALVSGANFATNVILARSLGIHDYGVFALAWSAVLFASSLQWAFIISPLMSVGPKQAEQQRPSYLGAVLLQEVSFSLICATALYAALMLACVWLPGWHTKALALPLAFTTLAYLLQDFIRRYFFSVRRSGAALASDALSYLSQIPIIIALIEFRHASVTAVLWVIGATSLASLLVGCEWLEPFSFSLSSIREVSLRHWKLSRWLAPSAFMQWSSANLFSMAAPLYYGAAAAGILRASQNIVGVAHIWFLGLDNVVPAEAARRLHQNGVSGSISYVRQIIFRWGVITLVFLTLVALFPSLSLGLLYGSKYVAYGGVLRLYAVLYFIVFFNGPLRAALQALEHTAPIFWSYSAMTLFSLACAGPLAKHLGLEGVLLGMIAIQVLFQAILGSSLLAQVRFLHRREHASCRGDQPALEPGAI
jgi:O-antigen/teichoic acid export membrane protein